MKPAILTHSLPSWSCSTLKKALTSLYKHNMLSGKSRALGILLTKKIFKREHLSSAELSGARLVVRQHAHSLAYLIQHQKFYI